MTDEEKIQIERARKAKEDSLKLLYDSMKHLTTLSTGSTLLLLTLLDKMFKNPQWKILILLTFFCFILTTLIAFFSMGGISEAIEEVVINEKSEKTAGCLAGFSFLFFILGTVLLVTFTVKNFYS